MRQSGSSQMKKGEAYCAVGSKAIDWLNTKLFFYLCDLGGKIQHSLLLGWLCVWPFEFCFLFDWQVSVASQEARAPALQSNSACLTVSDAPRESDKPGAQTSKSLRLIRIYTGSMEKVTGAVDFQWTASDKPHVPSFSAHNPLERRYNFF